MTKEILDRMVEEFTNLKEKIEKLRSFLLDDEKTKDVDNLNKDLLIGQLKAMEAYLSILSIRIGINPSKVSE
jgi:hypothetical protein